PGQAPMFPMRPGGGRPGGRPGFGPQNRFQRPSGPASIRRPVNTPEMAAHKKVIKIEEQVSLQKLAGLMSLKVTDVLMKLLGMGMTGVNINSTIDSDTAKILAGEFGWTVEDVAMSEEQTLEAAMGLDDKADYELVPRPPIVTVMGHVDHGKTSLLDRIRKTSVAAGEAGGITQHIGAYRVETAKGTIAFLDTPGHEAFTAMRARGAQVTDIVILVVAADDGVMPQTREAISHAQSAKVPIIVAVNKIDKPGAEPDKIKRELANLGLSPEEWGGETLYCHVSALTGQGIEQLLEAISLQAEVLELTAAPKRRANGVVIEALLDRGRGPVARVMIQDGTLRTGDILLAGAAWGKVRAMTDELGRALGAAGPATPVEVLGLNDVPSAGDPVHAVKDAKTAEEIAEQRKKKQSLSGKQDVGVKLSDLMERLKEADQLDLKLIIKGDVQGSVEAVAASLSKLSTPKVKVTIVHAAVGAITEGDVNLAIASKAIIVGFNVRPAGKASAAAETGGIEIRLYNIIYNAVDDIRAAMEGLLPTTKVEKALGAAEVRQVFRITKIGVVAGSYVTQGLVKRGSDARLVRDGIVVHTGKIASLRRVKEDVKEVAEGTECGITLESYQDIKEGDIIEAFEVEEVKQKLA
ncbi:MAG TPA: translation initiation factor IF-2, partial [Polyangiaceae bacterium]|nr:translation initiation factor IF-2 [Polyangiaceae bacterium]